MAHSVTILDGSSMGQTGAKTCAEVDTTFIKTKLDRIRVYCHCYLILLLTATAYTSAIAALRMLQQL